MGRVYHMPHIVNTSRLADDEFVSTFPATEWAASSATDVDEQTYPKPKAQTVTWWQRVLRRVRAWRIERMNP